MSHAPKDAHLLLTPQVQATPSATGERATLREALEPFIKHNSSDEFITITVRTSDVTRARAAIAALPAQPEPLRYEVAKKVGAAIVSLRSAQTRLAGHWPLTAADPVAHALEALQAIYALPAQPLAAPMNNARAQYFMERFKHEEKLLGPNEQAALDYVIAMLEVPAAPAPAAQPVAPASDPLAPPEVWDAINNGEFEPGQWTVSACSAIANNPSAALSIIARLRRRLAAASSQQERQG